MALKDIGVDLFALDDLGQIPYQRVVKKGNAAAITALKASGAHKEEGRNTMEWTENKCPRTHLTMTSSQR